jgi:hypothetical protein
MDLGVVMIILSTSFLDFSTVKVHSLPPSSVVNQKTLRAAGG